MENRKIIIEKIYTNKLNTFIKGDIFSGKTYFLSEILDYIQDKKERVFYIDTTTEENEKSLINQRELKSLKITDKIKESEILNNINSNFIDISYNLERNLEFLEKGDNENAEKYRKKQKTILNNLISIFNNQENLFLLFDEVDISPYDLSNKNVYIATGHKETENEKFDITLELEKTKIVNVNQNGLKNLA